MIDAARREIGTWGALVRWPVPTARMPLKAASMRMPGSAFTQRPVVKMTIRVAVAKAN
jgi:hypothetical protein